MYLRKIAKIYLAVLFFPLFSQAQNFEKVVFNSDNYLVVRPKAEKIKGVLVLLGSEAENIFPETKLHNIAYVNEILTIGISIGQEIGVDDTLANRINNIFKDVVSRFSVDKSSFVIGGFSAAGTIALRYTELSLENPDKFLIKPKAVFAIDSPVDIIGLLEGFEREQARNFSEVGMNEARYITTLMENKYGKFRENIDKYNSLSPFYANKKEPGNEKYLVNIPVRVYHDVDVSWQLKNRRRSLYDMNSLNSSEMISRLLQLGNEEAEFMISKTPGIRSNGMRHPHAWSIVDETECIQWIKEKLKIIDVNTWVAPYYFPLPKKWDDERFTFPIDFASQIPYEGIEELRFLPDWNKPGEENYWSYAFLWWLEGNRDFDVKILERNLEDYYSGLISKNIKEKKIDSSKIIPTRVSLKSVKTVFGDRSTFSGSIKMSDYMTQNSVTLNVKIHLKSCSNPGHSILIYELSPQLFDHVVWNQLEKINNEFKCERK